MTRTIGIVLYPDFEELDAIGPFEVFGGFCMSSAGRWQVVTIAEKPGAVRGFHGLEVTAAYGFDDAPELDVILLPGGIGSRTEMKNPKHIEFVQRQGRQAAWVTSVCTGALVLHQAGFLEGKRATTHWGSIPELQNLGGNTTVVNDERWVHDGNVITAAGVSAGIDMSLYLISLLKDPATAKRVQQMMEYYPKPPRFEGVSA